VSATFRPPGLARPVGCVRDGFGVPHLHAETRADVYRALGGVMASDRLWQMDLAVDSP
jgi:penicillin amidase